MKIVEYKGKCYKCLKDLCKELNLVYQTVCRRLKSGYSIEEAISKPDRIVKVIYKGAEWLRADLCKKHNISVSTFRSRIKSGYSVEEALQKEFVKTCVICNKKFVSKRPETKYCCKTCFNRGGIYGKGAYKRYEYTCSVCGALIVTNRNYDKCKTHTCSEKCRVQLARIDRKAKLKHLKTKNLFDYSVTLENVFEKFRGVCVCCNKKLNFNDNCTSNWYPSIDHIKPLSKGGTHTWDNVQLMCRACNIAKSNKNIGGFYES